MFSGKYDDNGDIGSYNELTDISDAFGWEGKHNYVGFYHEPLLNLTNLDRIEVYLKGNIGANSKLDLRLRDTMAVSGDSNQPGHIYISPPIDLRNDFQKVTISKGDFKKNPDNYGTKDGELNWSGVNNVQLQVGKYEMYDRYSGAYYYGSQGTITMLTAPGLVAWQGNRNYVGFSYRELLNLTDLKSISVTLRGTGKIELHLEDGVEGNPNYTGNVYTTSPINLTDNFQKVTFLKQAFSSLKGYGLEGSLNWDKLKKVQLQVSETASTVYLQSVVIELTNGKQYIINDGTIESSKVYVESVKVFLSTGQASDNNGYKLLSNAHGALHINPSYFMPFAYRAFAEMDKDGAAVWNALIDATYSELNAALKLSLHNLNGELVVGKGRLIPNWYMLDKLTGERTDISNQKPNGNVQGYVFGYDAFRTIWYIAFDYSRFKDFRAKKFLQTTLPFFQQDVLFFYPTYQIDETPVDQYESGAGFPSVYANLFRLFCDKANEQKILNRLWLYKKSSSDNKRAWFSNPQNPSEGENEYFMNFWAFFGLYLYQQNNVNLQDVISALRILSGINVSDISFCDINGDNRIGTEEVIYLLQRIAELRK